MFILGNVSMWFSRIMRIFFFWIDKIIYNFIPMVYDLLISIARTSPISQGDIAAMADRIYKLLAVFMIFKVTFSLIMYVVNPDDFSDKTKGVGKLTANIIISLSLLILTPYMFRMAYTLQTILLEDNSLATVILGDNMDKSFLTTAGEKMAYITISPFVTPNLGIMELGKCSELMVKYSDGEYHANEECTGVDANTFELRKDADGTMAGLVSDDNFDEETLKTYVAGLENKNFGLMFRQSIVTATNEDNDVFIMDYKFIISTVVGVIVLLLLITFCMDVALRSIKLAFLQLVAPIPIISYVDPKSGKDGIFKKWYQMCFKTFTSLFVRLLALYFAVFIISRVADMKLIDIIDGSYVSSALISILIIIGALMFAKQLPNILKDLGIKLDGDGKFTLNPLKKLEEQAVGGKRITGAIGGMQAGFLGNAPGRKISGALGGALRGAASNGGVKGGRNAQASYNRRMRELRINGVNRPQAILEARRAKYGGDDMWLEREATSIRKAQDQFDSQAKIIDRERTENSLKKQNLEATIADKKRKAERLKQIKSAGDTLLEHAKANVAKNKASTIDSEVARSTGLSSYFGANATVSDVYSTLKSRQIEADTKFETDTKFQTFNGATGKWEEITISAGSTATPEQLRKINESAGAYQAKSQGVKDYYADLASGAINDTDFKEKKAQYERACQQSEVTPTTDSYDGVKGQSESSSDAAVAITTEDDYVAAEKLISDLEDAIKKVDEQTVVIRGEKMTFAEAKAMIEREKKELDEKKKSRQRARDWGGQFGHFGPPPGGK